MSKYTTEVRYICETAYGLTESAGCDNVDTIINSSRASIFNFDYPIFDENYRSVLENKILKHYYTREIGAETVGLWKLWLNRKMNEIMPYYNKLYESELLVINPLRTYSLEKTHKDSGGDVRTINENNSGTVNSKTNSSNTRDNTTDTTRGGKDTTQFDVSKGDTFQSNDEQTVTGNKTSDNIGSLTKTDNLKDMFSETPQNGISDVAKGNYLTNARVNDNLSDEQSVSKVTDINSETIKTANKHIQTGQENTNQVVNYGETNKVVESLTGSGSSQNDISNSSTRDVSDSVTTTREYIENIVGNLSGKSESKLLLEYRNTFLNIDMQVIGELEDLFMQLW